MTRRIFEFQCKEGHITERFIDYETVNTACNVCSNTATRIISPVRVSLDGTDPVYVSAYDRWARVHEEKRKQEQKAAQ